MENNSFGSSSSDLFQDPFILTTGRFIPGKAKEFCEEKLSPVERTLGMAELSYFKGDLDAAYEIFSSLLKQEDFETYVAALIGRACCDLACKRTRDLFSLYRSANQLKNTLPDDSKLKKLCDVFLIYFNIILHYFPALELPSVSVDAFAMPSSLKLMGIYAYSHYLIQCGDVGRAIGLAECALIFSGRSCPISEIYLSLIVSIGYMLRQTWDKAEYYFLHAWHLAQPDGFIMPFVEHRGLLSGVLEKCLRHREPQAYKIISDFSNTYHSSWVCVHNELTGEIVSDKLTAIEYNVATLASRGVSNTEIADFLGISVNSVRAHMRNIFNKLGIDSRKELNGFVI